jgi:putative transposase
MSLAPSTYHHRAGAKSAEAVAEETRLVGRVRAICAEFPRYGYRRVTAQLKAEGERINHKRVARIMREQDVLRQDHRVRARPGQGLAAADGVGAVHGAVLAVAGATAPSQGSGSDT